MFQLLEFRLGESRLHNQQRTSGKGGGQHMESGCYFILIPEDFKSRHDVKITMQTSLQHIFNQRM